MNIDNHHLRKSVFDRLFYYLDKRSPGDRFLLYVCGILIISSLCYLVVFTSRTYTTNTPTPGGSYTEGVIGMPRFVNPVLAITRADHDLVALVYSGLMKIDQTGILIPDVAESITVSDDGLVYNIVLKENVLFHDNQTLTAEDVAFTIALIQDSELKSPLRGNWNGVKVEIIDSRELNIVLEEPYVPFIENFTVGILPKHIWGNLTIEELPFSQYNSEPVGSGPYQIDHIDRNDAGLIDAYSLVSFQNHENVPNIEFINLRFYSNEETLIEAFKNLEIQGTAALPLNVVKDLANNYTVHTLPRMFGVFINQNRTAALRDLTARQALNAALNRDDLITDVLFGFGSPALTQIPPDFYDSTETSTATRPTLEIARDILVSGGWTFKDNGRWIKTIDEVETTLAITLTTINTPIFTDTTDHLTKIWGELGVEVNVDRFEQADLIQTVVRPREYEALLFGIDIGRSLDLYPFWHSSQRDDPGLNIAQYTNITVDRLLEKYRLATTSDSRQKILADIDQRISDEQPAILLFNPAFVYTKNERVVTPALTKLNTPSDRFSNISDWYMNESAVWPIFTKSI